MSNAKHDRKQEKLQESGGKRISVQFSVRGKEILEITAEPGILNVHFETQF